MIEIVIVGRGGQGGVTLAKLVAGMHFSRGRHVQAFGSYGAERSGAPIKAFIRIDEREISSRNQIYEPDDVIVLDPALIAPSVALGMKPAGWVILNSPEAPGHFAEWFGGHRVVTVDATRIALANSLGTRTTPIVNTTMLGAIARVFELDIDDVREALTESGFGGANVTAAIEAHERLRIGAAGSHPAVVGAPVRPGPSGVSILERAGRPPVAKTGSWAKQRPRRVELLSPCNAFCPAGNDVRGFLAAARNGDYALALEVLRRTSPLPAVCGRVCPAPCMDGCHRLDLDGSVNIRELERFVAEHAVPAASIPEPQGGPVAVIGSGPAGLSAVYHLVRRGYAVELHERDAELGGLMRTGIPAYRLPPEVLDREIAEIVRCGVKVKTDARVGPNELVAIARQCVAVFVATGLQSMRGLGLGDAPSPRIVQGLVFLDQARQGLVRVDGEEVVIVGGGNTALDAARSALRLGARSVRILYRRTRAEMPALREELQEALEEGIRFDELVAPVGVRDSGSSLVLSCARMRLAEPDASGRPRPVPDSGPGSRYELECARVVLALGSSPDASILPGVAQGLAEGVLLTLESKPVLVGGDFATNEGTVAHAIASGRRVAEHIHALVSGVPLEPRLPPEVVPAERIRTSHFPRADQQQPPVLVAEQRVQSFREVRGGLGPEQARREAARCFTCGACTYCDICRAHCPEGIVTRDGSVTYRFDYDYCKGCGICALECPRGVVVMEQI
ncbi:MAG: 2-oxoacid:acceptor oxidoreductase family protein [Polyangiaceae bacterium]|nr:2-oxoacid:acceptor oxidoreductase family protein [Polyangiaceae bacterium]